MLAVNCRDWAVKIGMATLLTTIIQHSKLNEGKNLIYSIDFSS